MSARVSAQWRGMGLCTEAMTELLNQQKISERYRDPSLLLLSSAHLSLTLPLEGIISAEKMGGEAGNKCNAAANISWQIVLEWVNRSHAPQQQGG